MRNGSPLVLGSPVKYAAKSRPGSSTMLGPSSSSTPLLRAMFIDTHAHLYHNQFKDDRAAMVQRALDGGVKKLFLPNIDTESIEAMDALAEAYPDGCFPMMGLHPCSVGEDNEAQMAEVEQLLRTGRYCAVGEIGIDLHWDKTWIVQQQNVFRQHVRWAKEMALPIVIHCRESFEETIAIVEEENTEGLRGVFHCFTGTPEHAERIKALGDFYLGIGGVSLSQWGLAETMPLVWTELACWKSCALSRILPHRGKRTKQHIPCPAKLASLGAYHEHVAHHTANAERLFFIRNS